MASIGIDNVVKKFGGLTVLDGISVDVEDKEFVVLVGPSGCGKSTLLRMIAGLEDISGGEISIDGKVVNGLGPQKRDLAMVFQSYALYPHMTTEENMGFSLKLRGRPANEIKSAVEHAAQTLHLTDFLDRLPRHLSGGQRQRVAMGRAIVRDPRAFLFDEPLSNLDAKLRTHMRVEIRRLHQHLGATSIYVTHDQVEAMTMADRIVVMNAGRIEQIGTPIELYDKPANMFVAGFLGAPAMNFVTGAVESDGASGRKLVIASGPHSLPLPDGLKGELPGKLCVGVRPQDIELSQGQSGTASVSVDVQVVEQTGCETNLLVDIDGTEWTVQTRDRVPYKPGDLVHLTVRPESIHMFDCHTTERLS